MTKNKEPFYDVTDAKTLVEGFEKTLKISIDTLSRICFKVSRDHGFWEDGADRNKGEMIALMHSELSEALEGLRDGNMENVAEELADTMIRIFDFCGGFRIDIATALIEKIKRNIDRPYKHGRQF